MPSILFDRQIFKQQRYGGISRYFSRLMDNLAKTEGYTVLPRYIFSDNAHLHPNRISLFTKLNKMPRFRGRARLLKLFDNRNDLEIKSRIQAGRFDLFHPTYYRDGFLEYFPKEKPFVITVYDMIHELYYDPLFGIVHDETRQKAILLPKAAHIIAISHHTKRDILALYPEISPEKISVVYLGFSPPQAISAATSPAFTSSYLLFVGSRSFYKNFQWFLKAAASFLQNGQYRLICAGGGDFSREEKELIYTLNLADKVVFADIPNDGFLQALYRGAFCFIFPSRYEGFGLPVLEAFAAECPAVLADASCFREVGGDAALYFELDNEESLMAQIESLSNSKKRNRLIEAGKARVQLFSWENTADQHRRIYEMVLSAR